MFFDFPFNKRSFVVGPISIFILPQDNNIQNDQRQDWKDDVEHGVKSQNIDIDVPIICPG